ncbi:MAG: hypothetical protein ACC647_06525 [Anaerolineales bacterium]
MTTGNRGASTTVAYRIGNRPAVYAAGLEVGIWDDLEDFRSNRQIDETWQPPMIGGRREELYAGRLA